MKGNAKIMVHYYCICFNHIIIIMEVIVIIICNCSCKLVAIKIDYMKQ